MNKFALLCFLALFSYGSNSDAQVYRTTDNRQLEGPSCPTGFWSQLTSSLINIEGNNQQDVENQPEELQLKIQDFVDVYLDDLKTQIKHLRGLVEEKELGITSLNHQIKLEKGKNKKL